MLSFNRKILWSGVGLLMVGVLGGIFLADQATKHSDSASKDTSYATVQACDVLTASVAKQVIGDQAVYKPLKDTTFDTAKVSYCAYRTTNFSVSLVASSPLTEQGVKNNQNEFSEDLPANAQTVSGYGDAAFWLPGLAQLNILQHHTWYILSAGPLTPADRTLAQSEQFANLVKNKL